MLAKILTAAQVAELPVARAENITPATRARLSELIGYDFGTDIPSYQPGDAINGALFGVFYGGLDDAERVAAVRLALAENGYVAPSGVTAADVLEQMTRVWSRPWGSDDYERAVSYAVAVALAAGEVGAAMTILDGPEGAGVGWQLVLESLQAKARVGTAAAGGLPDFSDELAGLPVHLLRLVFEAGMSAGEDLVAGSQPELSRVAEPSVKAVIDAIALTSLHGADKADPMRAAAELYRIHAAGAR